MGLYFGKYASYERYDCAIIMPACTTADIQSFRTLAKRGLLVAAWNFIDCCQLLLHQWGREWKGTGEVAFHSKLIDGSSSDGWP